MKCLMGGLLLFAVVGVLAQGANQAAPEDLTQWMHRIPLKLPEVAQGQFVQVPLTPALYGVAQETLQDVRLGLADGTMLPYAVVELNGSTQLAVREGKIFDRLILPDRSEQLTIDLGERPDQHNEIVLDVSARSYGRAVRIEASNEGNRFAELAKGELVWLSVGGQSIDQRQLFYGASRTRFLRITLGSDRVDTTAPPVLRDVRVRYRLEQPAHKQRGPVVSVSPREPVRLKGEAASAWTLTLPDRVPVVALCLQLAAQQIERPWRVERLLEGSNYWEPRLEVVGSGVLRRAASDPEEPIQLPLQERYAQQLRLTIVDARNMPLNLAEVEYETIKRLVVFQAPAPGQVVYAYAGNPTAPPPRYEMTLPPDLTQLPEGLAGARLDNPNYQPPPPAIVPWTERNRWLIDALTVGAASVLALLLLSMALANLREAVARKAGQSQTQAKSD
ncbi:MAG: DUF3999 family protein [Gemmataceae bacterium]